MSPIVAPDNSMRCECGARWVLKSPRAWGARMTCVDSHSRDFLDKVVPRTNAVETMGGRGGHRRESIKIPYPSLWLRVKVWWWRKRRGGGD